MTKERPILFSGAMVRAILDGRKTQTRRVVKHRGTIPPPWATYAEELSQLKYDLSAWAPSGIFMWSEEQTPGEPLKPLRRWPFEGDEAELPGAYAIPCPYGQPGDRLWVRETHSLRILPEESSDGKGIAWYRADGDVYQGMLRWRPSIHMPRWACRLELEITGVRVERLNDCSDADAAAEGWPGFNETSLDSMAWYSDLWEQINGAGAWEANPWVWVVEFKRAA